MTRLPGLLLGVAVSAAPLLWWPERPVLLGALLAAALAGVTWRHPASVAASIFPVAALATAALALGVDPPHGPVAVTVVLYAMGLPAFLITVDGGRVPVRELALGGTLAGVLLAIGTATAWDDLPLVAAIAGVTAAAVAVTVAVSGLRSR